MEERALSNDEVTRSEAIRQNQANICRWLRNVKDLIAGNRLTRRKKSGQLGRLRMRCFPGALSPLRNTVCAFGGPKEGAKTAFALCSSAGMAAGAHCDDVKDAVGTQGPQLLGSLDVHDCKTQVVKAQVLIHGDDLLGCGRCNEEDYGEIYSPTDS